MQVRAKRMTTLFAMMALLGSLVVAGSAGANDTVSYQKPAKNVLDLVLDGTEGDKFVYKDQNNVAFTELLTIAQQCKATESGSPDVVTLGATGPGNAIVGLRNHALGVKSQGEGNGEPCRRVNVGETLTIRIDNTNANAAPTLETKFFGSFQIAAEFKFNGDMKVERLLDGVVVAQDNPNPQIVLQCTGSDCGPDSGLADAAAVHYDRTKADSIDDVLFNGVRLTSTGAVSVIDVLGDPTLDTWFEIVGLLDCGDTTDLISQTASAVNGQYWRLANGDGSDCAPKPYNADVNETQEGVVTFFPAPAPGQEKAYFLGQFVGTEATQPATQQRTLQYDDVPPPGPFNEMEWCVVVENTGVDNETVPAQWTGAINLAGENQRKKILESVGDDPSTTDKIEFYPQLPDGNEPPLAGEETWCLVRSESVARAGEVVRTFDTYGFGDPYKIY